MMEPFELNGEKIISAYMVDHNKILVLEMESGKKVMINSSDSDENLSPAEILITKL